jgi:hypothetical protein
MAPKALLSTLLLLGLLAASTAGARTIVLDDTGTLPYDTPLTLHWQQPPAAHRSAANTPLIGTTAIRVRLNVGAYLHRQARIYLTLPAQPPATLTASWTTQGRLLPGRVVAGQRTLVYQGPITTPYLEEVLQLTLNVDARALRQLYHVNFQFQMDE